MDLTIVKLCLHVSLIGDTSATIELCHVDKQAITKPSHDGINYHIFRNTFLNFSVWSFGEFSFNEYNLRLPAEPFIKDKMIFTFTYKTEEERRKSLKNMYTTLQKWACDPHIFMTNFSDKNSKNVSIHDDYWLVY